MPIVADLTELSYYFVTWIFFIFYFCYQFVILCERLKVEKEISVIIVYCE